MLCQQFSDNMSIVTKDFIDKEKKLGLDASKLFKINEIEETKNVS